MRAANASCALPASSVRFAGADPPPWQLFPPVHPAGPERIGNTSVDHFTAHVSSGVQLDPELELELGPDARQPKPAQSLSVNVTDSSVAHPAIAASAAPIAAA